MIDTPSRSKVEQAYGQCYLWTRYAPGRADYYGFEVIPQSEDGRVYQLNITFKSGEKYCCNELGCHFGFWGKADWVRFRAYLPAVGLADIGPLTITKIKVKIEQGSFWGVGVRGLPELLPSNEQEYERVGPFDEASALEK